jgi:predicted Rossmann-fold nucleotide-binding protein
MRTRAVIGLMGGDQQAADARRIGSAIAGLGEILLTGSSIGDESSRRIHRAAMHAAWLTGQARLIGILRRGHAYTEPSNGQTIELRGRPPLSFETIQGTCGFYVHTGMESEERDAITDATPDVLIFLKGGSGTLCELAYAAAAGRRTYFVESAKFLKADSTIESR